MNRARPLFLAQSSAATASSISALAVLAAIDQQAYPPQVDVLQAGLFHAHFESLLQLFARAPLLKSAFPDMPGITEVHLVAAALQGVGVCENFLTAAGIDIIDAAFDAAGDDLVAVLLEVACARCPRSSILRLLCRLLS